MKRISVLLALALLTQLSTAFALPFNQDMAYDQNLPPGTLMRQLPEGSVPVGSLSRYVPSRDAALKMVNPFAGNPASIANGERLYNINCSACHGMYRDGKHVPSTTAQLGVPALDLSQGYLRNSPDGHFFSFIHFGGVAIMPPYGYKLSITEHWDIVSYIRKVQADMAAKG